jgi:hypothetical protein
MTTCTHSNLTMSPICLCQIPLESMSPPFNPSREKSLSFSIAFDRRKIHLLVWFTWRFITHGKGALVLYSERILRSADGLSIFLRRCLCLDFEPTYLLPACGQLQPSNHPTIDRTYLFYTNQECSSGLSKSHNAWIHSRSFKGNVIVCAFVLAEFFVD